MAFIQSSSDTPLAALAGGGGGSLGPSANAVPVASMQDDSGAAEEPEAQDDAPMQRYEGPIFDHLVSQIDKVNLAEDIDDETLNKLGMLVVFEYNIDENSRSDWKDKAEKAMKFATQQTEEKQYPWPKASNIIWPLITQAAQQFNARAYPAIVQNRSVVKGIVWGSDKGTPATKDGKPAAPDTAMANILMVQNQQTGQPEPLWLQAPGSKRLRADRIGEHMSWQLLDEMPEWEAQTDTMLLQIPIVGGAVRKTYRDHLEDRNASVLVPLKNLVWNYHAPSFETAPRHTEIVSLYPHEIEANERAELFLHVDYGPGGDGESNNGQAEQGDEDAPHTFLEQHRRYDLDGDGYPEPYIVTVHKRSSKVVRIVARYDEDDIRMSDAEEDDTEAESDAADEPGGPQVIKIAPVDHYTLIPFLPNPDGGSYPIGFGHLLKPINEAINTTINQMFDAGHLQNAGGGFVSDQLSIHSGTVSFQVGKYVRVTSKGQSIRDAVFPLPFQGPSSVLFQLLGVLMSAGKELASIQDILMGDQAGTANTPATTVLALIEQGLAVYTAIHKRIYRALKSEFAKLYRLNRIYLDGSKQGYRIGDEYREIEPDDYKQGGGVEPIADPTMITKMQKLARANILLMFKDDPLLNQKEIRQRFFDAADFDRVEDLFAPPNPQAQQMQMAVAQAELGKMRAAELKDQSQAFLNMAQAREKASDAQLEWIDKQLRVMELKIEAMNAQTRAAQVDVQHHRNRIHERETDARLAEAGGEPVPGNGPGDVQPMAPPSGNGGVPALSAGPSQPLPLGGGGLPGGGDLAAAG